MENPESRSQRRPRISLLSLLLLTAIVALSITTTKLWREVVPLRQENRRLRDEVGELTVNDLSKLHVLRVKTDNELEWKWRVWIPEGAAYRIHMVDEAIPADGFPPSSGSVRFDTPGEHFFRYVIRRDPVGEHWESFFETGGAGVGGGGSSLDWVDSPKNMILNRGVGYSTKSFDKKQKRIELIRHRVSQVNNSANVEERTPGFLIWLVPAP